MMISPPRPPPLVLLLGTDGAHPDRLPLSTLIDAGFRIVDRRDDAHGLAAALSLKPDVIVMDVVQGNPLALDLGRQLQSHTDTQHVPLIAVTGEPTVTQVMVTVRVRTCSAQSLHEEINRVLEQLRPAS